MPTHDTLAVLNVAANPPRVLLSTRGIIGYDIDRGHGCVGVVTTRRRVNRTTLPTIGIAANGRIDLVDIINNTFIMFTRSFQYVYIYIYIYILFIYLKIQEKCSKAVINNAGAKDSLSVVIAGYKTANASPLLTITYKYTHSINIR